MSELLEVTHNCAEKVCFCAASPLSHHPFPPYPVLLPCAPLRVVLLSALCPFSFISACSKEEKKGSKQTQEETGRCVRKFSTSCARAHQRARVLTRPEHTLSRTPHPANISHSRTYARARTSSHMSSRRVTPSLTRTSTHMLTPTHHSSRGSHLSRTRLRR